MINENKAVISGLKRFPLLPSCFFFLCEAFWVWGLEPRGHNFDLTFGLRFVKYYVFPVGFWVIAIGFAVGLALYAKEEIRGWLLRMIPFGLLVHLCLLFGQFLFQRTSASLNTFYFSLYCNSIAVLGIGLCLYAIFYFFLDVEFRISPFRFGSLKIFENPYFWLSIIFVIGFGFRFLAAFRLSGMGLQTVLTNSDDALSYYGDAVTFLKGNPLKGYFSVGESLMVALLLKVSRTNIRAVLIIQAILCAFLPVMIFFLASRFASKNVALLSALGCALSQLLIFNSANLTRESFGGLFTCGGVLVFLKLWDSKSFTQRFVWGLFFSLVIGGLFLFDVSLQLAFLAFTFLLVLKWSDLPFWKRGTWFLVLLLLPKLFMATVSWKATGQFQFLGRDPLAARTLNTGYSPEAIELLVKKHIDIFGDPKGSVVNFFKDVPGVSTLLLRKWRNDFCYYFFEGYSGAFDPVILVRISTLAGNLNFYLYLFGFIGFFQLAVESCRAPFLAPARTLMLLFMVLCASPYILLFLGHTRYRVAIQPFIIICCVSGIVKTMVWIAAAASSVRVAVPSPFTATIEAS